MSEYDPTKPLWSIMTKSRGGTVSVIRDLTLDQVRRTYERLDPWYGMRSRQFSVHKDFLRDGVLAWSSGSAGRMAQDGDIEIREIFGPPGWQSLEDVEQWPKVTTIYTDYEGDILPDEYQENVEAAAWEREYQRIKATSSR
jgi:hypothetical protein